MDCEGLANRRNLIVHQTHVLEDGVLEEFEQNKMLLVSAAGLVPHSDGHIDVRIRALCAEDFPRRILSRNSDSKSSFAYRKNMFR